MIWTKRDNNGDICFFTSDNKKFHNIKDATEYVASNYDNLIINNLNYNIDFERKRKLNIITDKIFNQRYN